MASSMEPINEESDLQFLEKLCSGLPLDPLPPAPPSQRDPTVPHAPVCSGTAALAPHERRQAVRNALRYFPDHLHTTLAPEFVDELERYGHIYMYRFMPDMQRIRAYPLTTIPALCRPHAAAVILMILNNLDMRVAQYPHELVTYGTSGQVFSNWAQFLLTLHYLATMTSQQTLVIYSGHPHGLFPSAKHAPRVLVTNGMVVDEWGAGGKQYERLFALGVSQYGQMTAGSFCYIGPQGIVHGTTLTLLGAARRQSPGGLEGRVFLSAGLGGMSGAQPKAAVIAGCVGVVAEVCRHALDKRHGQGWLDELSDDLDDLIRRIRRARLARKPLSIGYHGNVVEVWERLVEEHRSTGDLLVDLGSDQSSCHAAYSGGYWPVQLQLSEAKQLLAQDPDQFAKLVALSLRRQTAAINYLSRHGMYFWDYGNAFLLEAAKAGADVLAEPGSRKLEGLERCGGEVRGVGTVPDFRYPSYVQDVMGEIFSLGFGPFRWVCTSGSSQDLALTDTIAIAELTNIIDTDETLPNAVQQQYKDNILWLQHAAKHQLVVGSQARILYTDAWGRRALARAFNRAVAQGQLAAPVIISRDHHDVSACDSPFRETADIADGSAICADMAVQNCLGSAARGATWAALHNGGGVGWGRAVNGGFGLVLDGTAEAEETAGCLLGWDVNNGVGRRAWAGNNSAQETIKRAQETEPQLRVTVGHQVDTQLLKRVVTAEK